ncbi:MAG: DNA repair protein RecO [bacterium]
MSHTIYTTEAIVLKSLTQGEANKYYYLFTRDFGLIKATAQGVRYLKSKLRYSLQDFAYLSVSVVRGRDIWRITSADKKKDLKILMGDKSEKFLIITRIFSLLLRLLHGEEKNEIILENLLSGIDFLEQEDLDAGLLSSFETILALRMLHALGYMGDDPAFLKFVASPFWSRDLLSEMKSVKAETIIEINKSLKETQL